MRNLYCRHCGYYWLKRVERPKFCTRCHCKNWFKKHKPGTVQSWKANHSTNVKTEENHVHSD